MKKTIFITAILFSVVSMFAQDVIIVRADEWKTKRIQATETKITDDSVTYKNFFGLDERTFAINKKDVIKIIWENGTQQVFVKTDTSEKTNIPQKADISEGIRINEKNLPYIYRQGNTFYLSNGVVYNKQQLEVFLKSQKLSHVYNRYNNGCNLLIIGWTLVGSAIVLEVIGMLGATDPTATSLLLSIGGMLEIAGITMAITGCVRKHKAINDYNNFIVNHTRYNNVTYKAGLLGNRVGFALNF